MPLAFSTAALEWLAQALGVAPRDLSAARMKGSTSSSISLIRCAGAPHSRKFVLRLLDNREWLADEPDLAAHEVAALEEAQRAGLRAPRLVAATSADSGFGAPVVVMSFVEGDVVLRPANFQAWLAGIAGELAAIHRHKAEGFAWRYRSWVERAALAPPAWVDDDSPHVGARHRTGAGA